MNKMVRISANLNTLVGVARHIFRAAAVVVAVCVVVLLFINNDSIFENGAYTLSLGNVTLDLVADGAVPAEVTRNRIIIGAVLCVPLFLLTARCLGILQSILKPMSESRPFDRSVSDSLRKLSFYVLAGGFLTEAGRMLIAALQLDPLTGIKLDALFNPEMVSGCTVEIVMNTGFLFLFAALYLMSHVFRYGEELQQLSDETL